MPDNFEKQGFDLVIIGAGIHGAAIANEAGKENLSVLLLEQFDMPAQGTSSRSSKLIHGGLRYLEHLEIGLVYECLSDRKRLLDKYPDLVKLVKFYIPVYRSTSRSSLMIRTGLSLYAVLGGMRQSNVFRTIARADWGALDGLKTQGLISVYQYFDAQTDDARLTERVLDEAKSLGAQIEFGSELISCNISDTGVTVTYDKEDKTHEVTARFMVNAGGPWVNQVIARCRPEFKPIEIDLVRGTHIEIPGELKKGIYYLEAPQDQRAVFAMPWKGHILVGTTEKIYTGDPARVTPADDEIDYLLEVFHHYFPGPTSRVRHKDIIASWAGLRVLPKSETNPFQRTRETLFHVDSKDAPRVYSIYGGKLTSHYSTARKLLNKIKRTES